MFAVIDRVIERQKARHFTGHIKFGVEKSVVVSMTINSRLEQSDNENANYDRQLVELCSIPEFYGSIEFDLVLGKIVRLNYCISFNGANLKRELGDA